MEKTCDECKKTPYRLMIFKMQRRGLLQKMCYSPCFLKHFKLPEDLSFERYDKSRIKYEGYYQSHSAFFMDKKDFEELFKESL